MKTLLFFVFCFQACYFQMAYSQYIGTGLGLGYPAAIAPEYECGCGSALATDAAYGPGIAPSFGLGLTGPAPFAGPAAYAPGPAYGGAGIGDVEVAGEMPVAGTTLVAGQVPILGAVQFSGEIPAGGIVSIAGRCGCGCNGPYI